ncbi:MAG: hypothetical protein ACI4MF_08095 [Candidatus Faecivicinus sp.]
MLYIISSSGFFAKEGGCLVRGSLQTVEKAHAEQPVRSSAAACMARSDFPQAQAAEKSFLPSANHPENREIFRFPQFSSCSMKILRFSSKVSKILFDTQEAASSRGSLLWE